MVVQTRKATAATSAGTSVKKQTDKPTPKVGEPITSSTFHPEKECDHRTLPLFNVKETDTTAAFLQLETQSYPATLLVKWTRDEWVMNRRHQSLLDKAKKSFTELYKKHASGDDDQQKVYAETWSEAETTTFLEDLMNLLDQAFFFSAMTKPYGGRMSSLVRLTVCDGAEDAKKKRGGGLGQRYGFAQALSPPEAAGTVVELQVHTKVTTWAKNGAATTSSRSLTEMTQTLVHEMCHAYLELFACHNGSCALNRINTFGFMGHGLTFQTLSAAVAVEIGKWDEDFSDDFSNRSCSGSSYCNHNSDTEHKKYVKAKEQGKLTGLLAWTTPSRRSGGLSWIAKSTGRIMLKPSARVVKYQSDRGGRRLQASGSKDDDEVADEPADGDDMA